MNRHFPSNNGISRHLPSNARFLPSKLKKKVLLTRSRVYLLQVLRQLVQTRRANRPPFRVCARFSTATHDGALHASTSTSTSSASESTSSKQNLETSEREADSGLPPGTHLSPPQRAFLAAGNPFLCVFMRCELPYSSRSLRCPVVPTGTVSRDETILLWLLNDRAFY